ncbi:MAG: MlaD family protein [Alphaproteobacteria bacterium]|nr:MlaD family protein [Alphaproteobacteria bacterium]
MRTSENKEIVAGAITVVAVIATLLMISFHSFSRHVGDFYNVKAVFNQIYGLENGSVVRVAGIDVGRVVSIKFGDNYRTVVEMRLPESIKLPDDSSASIYSHNIMGSKYVSIDVGGSDDYIEDGGFIDYTQASPQLMKLAEKVVSMTKSNKK